MNDRGVVEMVLAVRRTTVLGRVLLGLAVLAGLLYWFYLRNRHSFPWVGGFTIILFGYVLFVPLRLLITGQAIIITDRGLIDRTSGLDFIAWDEIRGVQRYPFMGRDLVALDLLDVQAVIGRLSLVRRWMWQYYLKKPGTKPTLAAPLVEGGSEALLSLINERARGRPEGRAV